MAALRQSKNLRRILCKSRLDPNLTNRPIRSIRTETGWKSCSGNSKLCPICPYAANPTKQVKSEYNGYVHTIKEQVNCQSKNVIYLWRCKKLNCKDHPKNIYIGKTIQTFQKRFSQHIGYIKSNNVNEPSGSHFTLSGHSVADIEGLVLEQVRSKDPFILKRREHFYIRKFDSFRNGLNRES